ncbi:unnamed protein product [Agarophyton chilense]|eukprot:gb/GEZJ01000148.1/.p1 GENE.gb/GEZJ01000148.1/~~gb/GEZJ01000148.1/.p1  ORF type:complete len:703 (-),score=90.28 gb/GEZJ01000148.1/:3276-5384(-)
MMRLKRTDNGAFISTGFGVIGLRGLEGNTVRRTCVERRRQVAPNVTRAVLEVSKNSDINEEGAAGAQGEPSTTTPLFNDIGIAGEDGDAELEENGDWYRIVDRISKQDEAANLTISSQNASGNAVFDLGAVDENSRTLLTRNCYAGVVNVDIEEGGVLADDEDNNDMFCGVGLEALVESEELLENLEKNFGITTATHVQLAAIPRVTDGKDIVIQSHTGSGKTLAFLLPVLDEIDIEHDITQVVIVAPTRELAMQISRECDRLIEGTDIRNMALIGGANPARQAEKLRKKTPHIVTGTPGRLAELHEGRDLNLRHVQTLIVDEVDQCLQEVFMKHITRLLHAVRSAQKVLVSATGDVDSVRNFAMENMNAPVLLRVGGSQRIPKAISHWHYLVPARLKIDALRKLMYSEPVPTRAIVFVDDPRRVDIVVHRLHQMKLAAGGLRGNAHKLERAEVLTAFRKGRVVMLVTTEVAARGLDVRDITHVINLDMPTDGDHYLHRAGRCGRIGGDGHVISITNAETAFVVTRLARELGIEITRMEPRGGAYREPLDRSSSVKHRTLKDKESLTTTKRNGSRGRDASSQSGKGGSLNGSIVTPRNAPTRARLSDKKAVQNERRLREVLGGTGKPKRKKLKEVNKKTEARERIKTKLKAKEKAETRAVSRAKAKKNESSAKVSGTDATSLNRKSMNPSAVAKREGWVGNR